MLARERWASGNFALQLARSRVSDGKVSRESRNGCRALRLAPGRLRIEARRELFARLLYHNHLTQIHEQPTT